MNRGAIRAGSDGCLTRFEQMGVSCAQGGRHLPSPTMAQASSPGASVDEVMVNP
jgi:hypothetical protein